MKNCVSCGDAFIPHHGNAKRCAMCMTYPADRPVSSDCLTCGDFFRITTKQGPIPKYCSRRCGQRNSSPLRVQLPASCAWCEIEFLPESRRQKVCSPQCRYDLRAREKAGWPYIQGCAACGRSIVIDPLARKQKIKKFCGPTCVSQGGKHTRRARIAGVPSEDIDRNLVFERDEYICGLCHQPVNRTLQYPDPMSKSLDHIIPISRGGSHTYDNVQLAHLCCNVKASSKRTEFELAR